MVRTEDINDWVEAWNAYDLDRIMLHYADSIEFTAQTVVSRWNKPDGKLNGKEDLRQHFRKGLDLAPNVHFTIEEILYAPNGYAVLYRRENGNRVLDAVELDKTGLAIKVTAYYLDRQS